MPFPPRTRTTFPRPSAMGRPARSQCRATGLLLPAPRPPRPSLPVLSRSGGMHQLAPHAPTPRSLSRALLITPHFKSGAWCSRAPSPRRTGTPVSLSSLSPVFSPEAPSPRADTRTRCCESTVRPRQRRDSIERFYSARAHWAPGSPRTRQTRRRVQRGARRSLSSAQREGPSATQ